MNIRVRRAQAHEYEEIGLLTLAGFGHAGPEAHLPEQDRLELLLDASGRDEQGVLLVAEDSDNEQLLGTATVLPSGVPYARQATSGEAELRLLAVDPLARGRGVAWQLLEEAARVADSWGSQALVLDTGAGNIRSRNLYDGFGYERQPWRDVAREYPKPELVVYAQRLWDSDVVVRQAHASELADVAELTLEAYEADYELFDEYRQDIADISKRAAEHQVWIAASRSTRQLLGTVTTPRAGNNISALGESGELDFRFLATALHCRGQGIASLLVRHVEWLAVQRGLRRVVLNSGSQMHSAHALYGKLGYRRLHIREQELPKIGHLLAFGKQIDPLPMAAY